MHGVLLRLKSILLWKFHYFVTRPRQDCDKYRLFHRSVQETYVTVTKDNSSNLRMFTVKLIGPVDIDTG